MPSGVPALLGKYQDEGERGGAKQSQTLTIDQWMTSTALEVRSFLTGYHLRVASAAG